MNTAKEQMGDKGFSCMPAALDFELHEAHGSKSIRSFPNNNSFPRRKSGKGHMTNILLGKAFCSALTQNAAKRFHQMTGNTKPRKHKG